jgi:hypothetical protein
MVHIQVELDGKEVLKHCCGGRAVALLQIADPQGQPYRNYAAEEIKAQPSMNDYVVRLSWDAFLMPGDYQLVIALYYSGKGGHSLTFEKLRVNSIKDDPLPNAWNGLPNVEFCDSQPVGVDEFLLPRVTGKLNVPIQSHRPLQIEILENLTPYATEIRKPRRYQQRLGVFLPILKSLGQLQVTSGSLSAAIMDFTRSRVTFEEKDISGGHLDLGGLKDALSTNPINVVDASVIRDSKHYGTYFAREITQTLKDNPSTNGSAKNRPLRVLIVVSGRMELGLKGQAAITPQEGADFVVFYLRSEFLFPVFDFGPGSIGILGPGLPQPPVDKEQLTDEIDKALKPLKPHIYSVSSPADVRKAMAAMIGELSKM